MPHYSSLFILAFVLGVIGVCEMVRGAYAIRREDFASMSSHHFVGVVFLTCSAAASAADTRDFSYVLMQFPFLMGALRAYFGWHPGRDWRFIRRRVARWNLAMAILFNVLLIFAGVTTFMVSTYLGLVQVVGAAVVSSALCINDTRRIGKLQALTIGRLMLCAASVSKALPLENAAAVVWAVLMAWSALESGRMLLLVRQEASKKPA